MELFFKNGSYIKVIDYAENKISHHWTKNWAVVVINNETAKSIFEDIEQTCGKIVSRRIVSKNEMVTEFTDGTILRWIRPTGLGRGIKFGKMWCDASISDDALQYIILPQYFGSYDDIVWI